MDFQSRDIIYYAVMWTLTFLAGVSRTLRDRDYERGWDVLSVGACGGFWGFCFVGICSYFGPGIADFGWGYLAIAAFIGLLGKEQEKLMRRLIFAGIEKATGIEADEGEDGLQEMHDHDNTAEPNGQDAADT